LKLKIRRSSRSSNKNQLTQLRKQLDRVTKELESVRKQLATAEEDIRPAASPEFEDLARQAYLRSLSRPPDDRETAVVVAYMEQAEDPIDGLRDVLWALLNTKEFVVNH
jgi:hypothetical protein